MGALRQIWTVTAMNLTALPSRAGASAVTVIGVATVVAVMLSLLGVGEGVLSSFLRNQQPGLVVVGAPGAIATMGSFSKSDVAQIAEAPGIKRLPDGRPMVQPNAAITVELQNKVGGGTSNVPFAGTGDIGALMSAKTFRMIQGRRFTAGLRELIAGRAAQARYKNLDVGDTVVLRGTAWKVVGTFEDGGAPDEGFVESDADTVLAAFNRTTYQNVAVELDSPNLFRKFKDALMSNPQLQVRVERQADYIRDQLRPLTALLKFVGYFVGGVMAIGVVFGALNTMYSAVDARKREIATLRALGFGGTAVIVSVIVESLVLAIPGALLGWAGAWLVFNNHSISMAGLSFRMDVSPALAAAGLVLAVAIGLIGGLAPAVRATRQPVAEALRAT
jgi:putative ABC transport system permease protein